MSILTEQNLAEIRDMIKESKETDTVDSIHENAYTDIVLLINTIHKAKLNIPTPEVFSADDGSLNISWLDKETTAHMGCYGNGHVIFNFYLHNHEREVSGYCKISDSVIFNGVIQILSNILNEK